MYFHPGTSAITNLPTAEQSALTATKSADAATLNRTMDTTLGDGQNSIALTSNASTSAQTYYFCRFVSPLLNQTNVTAQTWTFNFAASESQSSAQFPAGGSGDELYVCVYVWRPGTGKIGTVFDSQTAATANEPAVNTETAFNISVSGAAVASAAIGDVIICEVWFECTQTSSTASTNTFYFDGITVTTTNDTTVSNHASFIETAQNLTFQAGGAPIAMTQVSAITYSNKFITKV